MTSEPATDIEAQAESKTTTTDTDGIAEPKQVTKDGGEEAPAHASTVSNGESGSGSGSVGVGIGGSSGGGSGGSDSGSSRKKSAAETKEDLARVTQSLREDAHEGQSAIHKRQDNIGA